MVRAERGLAEHAIYKRYADKIKFPQMIENI